MMRPSMDPSGFLTLRRAGPDLVGIILAEVQLAASSVIGRLQEEYSPSWAHSFPGSRITCVLAEPRLAVTTSWTVSPDLLISGPP